MLAHLRAQKEVRGSQRDVWQAAIFECLLPLRPSPIPLCILRLAPAVGIWLRLHAALRKEGIQPTSCQTRVFRFEVVKGR